MTPKVVFFLAASWTCPYVSTHRHLLTWTCAHTYMNKCTCSHVHEHMHTQQEKNRKNINSWVPSQPTEPGSAFLTRSPDSSCVHQGWRNPDLDASWTWHDMTYDFRVQSWFFCTYLSIFLLILWEKNLSLRPELLTISLITISTHFSKKMNLGRVEFWERWRWSDGI